jgi:uncharacterized protein YwbE
VVEAGSPSTNTSNSHYNGIEVRGAEGHGLYVGRADRNGVVVNSAGDDGVYVTSAGNDGVHVFSAGSPSTTIASGYHNGIEVEGAEGYGLYVGRTDRDGVIVVEAGLPSTNTSNSHYNGIEVRGAEGYGLYVGRADLDGVHVNSAGGYAGYFNGDVAVTGVLTKGSGSFKIDHPLDPENKYLSHSFVESPDMMNVYNGNVILDARGEAWVPLPDWFEALNRDFRYQLTAIGAPGPNLYISEKIQGNRFKIAGGAPGMEVSWQVTGIRHDPFALAHPILVEEGKPEDERGTYLHPDAYDQFAKRSQQDDGGGE